MASGGAAAIQIVAAANGLPAGSTLENVARVSGDVLDPNPDNDVAKVSGVVDGAAAPRYDLALTKTASIARPLVGEQFTYRLAVHNNGPDAAQNVTLTDPVPAGLEIGSDHAGAGHVRGRGPPRALRAGHAQARRPHRGDDRRHGHGHRRLRELGARRGRRHGRRRGEQRRRRRRATRCPSAAGASRSRRPRQAPPRRRRRDRAVHDQGPRAQRGGEQRPRLRPAARRHGVRPGARRALLGRARVLDDPAPAQGRGRRRSG